MRLVRGATGFWGGSDEPLVPTDMASFSMILRGTPGVHAREESHPELGRDLSAPMAEVDLSELAKAELAQVRHWRPEVVSDLLFNWWD